MVDIFIFLKLKLIKNFPGGSIFSRATDYFLFSRSIQWNTCALKLSMSEMCSVNNYSEEISSKVLNINERQNIKLTYMKTMMEENIQVFERLRNV